MICLVLYKQNFPTFQCRAPKIFGDSTVGASGVCVASAYHRELAFCIKDYEISLCNATLCTKMVVCFLL